jgi:hypothetical protein
MCSHGCLARRVRLKETRGLSRLAESRRKRGRLDRNAEDTRGALEPRKWVELRNGNENGVASQRVSRMTLHQFRTSFHEYLSISQKVMKADVQMNFIT